MDISSQQALMSFAQAPFKLIRSSLSLLTSKRRQRQGHSELLRTIYPEILRSLQQSRRESLNESRKELCKRRTSAQEGNECTNTDPHPTSPRRSAERGWRRVTREGSCDPPGTWSREKLSLTFLKGKIVRLQLFLHFLPGKKTMKKLLNFFSTTSWRPR